jgi:hypothetical protein
MGTTHIAKTTPVTEKTAEEWRQDATRQEQIREDSWERSDTDGFLTQWAAGINSSLSIRKAEIAENGGLWNFAGLCDAKTGERIKAKMVYVANKFAPWRGDVARWVVLDENNKAILWLPVGANSRKQKALGFCEKREQAPADAVLEGKGYGLSGSCWVSVIRRDKGYPEGAKIWKQS